jgi:DNA-directed RNA polymerase specialized sigma24 family protein
MALRRRMETSTSICQTVISAAVFEGLTDRECAERLNVSHWLCTNRRREAKKTLTGIKVDLDLA